MKKVHLFDYRLFREEHLTTWTSDKGKIEIFRLRKATDLNAKERFRQWTAELPGEKVDFKSSAMTTASIPPATSQHMLKHVV